MMKFFVQNKIFCNVRSLQLFLCFNEKRNFGWVQFLFHGTVAFRLLWQFLLSNIQCYLSIDYLRGKQFCEYWRKFDHWTFKVWAVLKEFQNGSFSLKFSYLCLARGWKQTHPLNVITLESNIVRMITMASLL